MQKKIVKYKVISGKILNVFNNNCEDAMKDYMEPYGYLQVEKNENGEITYIQAFIVYSFWRWK